ncbi:uncharacterized protein LOC119399824 isoform X2 [Rhipicephalus sanguineus]|nr:uncharacterized protein LOC119399824 isoform X2 [Rhipicephalus sanguineus]
MTVHNKTVQAQLLQGPPPSMNMTDWNDISVMKKLMYYSKYLWCAIFLVNMVDDEHAVPWCELHVQGPALRDFFKRGINFTECDKKYKEICEDKPEIVLITKDCPNKKNVTE